MDRKSLLAGMTLGAAIAFGGMVLGGLGQPAPQPANPPAAGDPAAPGPNQGVRQAKVDWFDKLTVRQIDIVNSKGKQVMQISEAEDGAYLQIFNAAHQELVRIGNVLRGGGQIMTFDKGKKLIEMTQLGTGGAFRVCAQDKDEWVQITDGKDGPSILGGSPGNWVIEIPAGAGAPAPAKPNPGAPGLQGGPQNAPKPDAAAPAAPKPQ